MRTADFDFHLPPTLIAQSPAPQRDQSRLLVLDRQSSRVAHRTFSDLLEYLRPGDLLVLNNSRVFPARLHGFNAKSGGKFEMLLLEEASTNDWWVMIQPAKRARIGAQIILRDRAGQTTQIIATVTGQNESGHRRLTFSGTTNISDALGQLGETPLPPYIKRTGGEHDEDRERYQTVFAKNTGSVAAPTAGLHFTEKMLDDLRERGVQTSFVTLHVGLGTFLPVKAESLEQHTMHEERFELSAETANAINEAKQSARRVIAVGTTTVRVLESVAVQNQGRLVPGNGRTKIFIHPPYDFKIVDSLLTNFHLPCSTLLMLISAFASPGETRGREMILSAYAEAIRERYRFFSYGDAMLIL